MQHDDPKNVNADTKEVKVDFGILQDRVDLLAKDSGKIKGIVATRIEEDLKAEQMVDLFKTGRVIISKDASVEMVRLIKSKCKVGEFNKHYQNIFQDVLGLTLYDKVIKGAITDHERFEVVTKYVSRLLHKRPFTFYGVDDAALLRDGNSAEPNMFLNMGSNKAGLYEYMSYPELELSRRLALSALTYLYKFTGTGYEKLSAQPSLIHLHSGIRLERPDTLEFKRLIVTEALQPELFKTIKAGSLIHSIKFGEVCVSTDKKTEYLVIKETAPTMFLNLTLYKQWIRELFEHYFDDCQRMAKKLNKTAYVRLNGADLQDTTYTIATTNIMSGKILLRLAEVQYSVLKSLIDNADFNAKHDKISAIELSDPKWSGHKPIIKNSLVKTKKGMREDGSASLVEPMEGSDVSGSTDSVLFCVNQFISANAFPGNRIYKNNLSSLESEAGNTTNITTFLNPYINPLFDVDVLSQALLMHFPSGKLTSIADIQYALMHATKPSGKSASTTKAAAANNSTGESTAKSGFKLPSFKMPAFKMPEFKIPAFAAKIPGLLALLKLIFGHAKESLSDMAKSSAQAIQDKTKKTPKAEAAVTEAVTPETDVDVAHTETVEADKILTDEIDTSAAVPAVEPEQVVEQEAVVETKPVVEPEPVVKEEPTLEPEPVVKEEPVVEPEPVSVPDLSQPVASDHAIEDEPAPFVLPEDDDIPFALEPVKPKDSPVVEQAPTIEEAPGAEKQDVTPLEISEQHIQPGPGESESEEPVIPAPPVNEPPVEDDPANKEIDK